MGIGIPKKVEKAESYCVIRPCGGAMAVPYSSDLRVRVVDAVAEGATRREASERFGVSVSSAVRWHQVWRNEGRWEAKPRGGSRSPLDDHAEKIVALIEEQRDRTLDEIVAAMHKRKIPSSRTALHRFLERHGITLKKKSCTLPSRSG
jgi:transposase